MSRGFTVLKPDFRRTGESVHDIKSCACQARRTALEGRKPIGRLRIGYARTLGTQRGVCRGPGAWLRASGQKARDVMYRGAKRLDAASSGKTLWMTNIPYLLIMGCAVDSTQEDRGSPVEESGTRRGRNAESAEAAGGGFHKSIGGGP